MQAKFKPQLVASYQKQIIQQHSQTLIRQMQKLDENQLLNQPRWLTLLDWDQHFFHLMTYWEQNPTAFNITPMDQCAFNQMNYADYAQLIHPDPATPMLTHLNQHGASDTHAYRVFYDRMLRAWQRQHYLYYCDQHILSWQPQTRQLQWHALTQVQPLWLVTTTADQPMLPSELLPQGMSQPCRWSLTQWYRQAPQWKTIIWHGIPQSHLSQK